MEDVLSEWLAITKDVVKRFGNNSHSRLISGEVLIEPVTSFDYYAKRRRRSEYRDPNEIFEEICRTFQDIDNDCRNVQCCDLEWSRHWNFGEMKVYTFSDGQIVNISNDLVLNYPDSILDVNLIDLDSRSSEKEIEIDFRLKYLNELLSYMNYELNIWTLNGVEFEEFCRELMEMRIPFRMDIMNRLYNGFNECGVGWKNRCVVVNGNDYKMMFDCIKWKLSELRYNEERERIECMIDGQYENFVDEFSKYMQDCTYNASHSLQVSLVMSFLKQYPMDMSNMGVYAFFFPSHSTVLPESDILGQQYDSYLREWLGNSEGWKLIYRASEHGYSASSFHDYCDDKGPSLVIIKSSDSCIFGGYTTQSWKYNPSQPNQDCYMNQFYDQDRENPSSFIFITSNLFNVPPTRLVKRKESKSSIPCDPLSGPIFSGFGMDIYIGDRCNLEGSCSIVKNGTNGYKRHPLDKCSLFVNTKKPERNYFSVLDYEVFTNCDDNNDYLNNSNDNEDVEMNGTSGVNAM